jgi:hypothetical protein
VNAELPTWREGGMTSVVFSIFMLWQTAAPPAVVRVSGRVSIEGGAETPSSIILPLIVGGGISTPSLLGGANPMLIIRPQIDGTFRVQLPPGEYRLGPPRSLPPGYTLQSIVYGGVDLLRGPLKISGDDSAELLITIATNGPSPAVSVSGRVTGATSGQFQRIALREASGGELSAALESSVGADGSFTFPKVLPGAYIVYLRLRSVAQVMVGDKNVTGLIVAHPQDILVSGHVIIEGAQSLPTSLIVEGNGKAATVLPRANGTFILSLGNGENSISVRNIPEGWRLKSITYGDVDLQNKPLQLDGPATWDIVVRVVPKD